MALKKNPMRHLLVLSSICCLAVVTSTAKVAELSVLIGDHSSDGQQPANIAIGGKHHDTLFMAARTGVYTLKLKVKNWDQK